MSYSIVFSSKTGNTELIAKRISKLMGEDGCVYFGAPEQAPTNATDADIVFVGSWTDKGTSTSEMAKFVRSLSRTHAWGPRRELQPRGLVHVPGQDARDGPWTLQEDARRC